jgi:hypothetical protein
MSPDALERTFTVLGILAIVVPVWLKWGRPTYKALVKDFRAGRDALVGREAVLDSMSGTELAPALPGIGKRMENFEQALTTLAENAVTLADNQVTIADNQRVLLNHEDRIMALEEGAVERIVARAETTAAYGAMEAAYRSQPSEPNVIRPDDDDDIHS